MVRVLVPDIVALENRSSFEFSQRVPLFKLTALLVARFEDAAEMDSLSLLVGLIDNLPALLNTDLVPRALDSPWASDIDPNQYSWKKATISIDLGACFFNRNSSSKPSKNQ